MAPPSSLCELPRIEYTRRSITLIVAATLGGRSHHWDRLRLVAIYDVACFHVFYHWGLAGIGLPIFLVLTLALSVARGEASVREVARERFSRLMIPWAFWALAILIVRLARMALGAHDSYWRWPMLLYGPSDHLWFLPFAFFGAVILAFVRRRAPAHSVASLIACALLAALAIVAPFPEAVRTPFVQWPWSLPSLPLGYALGRAIEARGGPRAARKDAAILCAAALVAFAIASLIADATQLDSLIRFGAGIVLLTAVLFIPDAAERFTRAATPLVLGVYLLHDPLYEYGLRPLHLERWLRAEVLVVLLVLAITGVLVWFLRRTRLVRVL